MLLGHEFNVVAQKDYNKTKYKAKILNGLVPYFGVPVDATLLLFSPQPGMMLGMLLLLAPMLMLCLL